MRLSMFFASLSFNPWDSGWINYVVEIQGAVWFRDGGDGAWEKYSSLEDLLEMLHCYGVEDAPWQEIAGIPRQYLYGLEEVTDDSLAFPCANCGNKVELAHQGLCVACWGEQSNTNAAQISALWSRIEALFEQRREEWEIWRAKVVNRILTIQRPGYLEVGGDSCPQCEKKLAGPQIQGMQVKYYSCSCGWWHRYFDEQKVSSEWVRPSPDEMREGFWAKIIQTIRRSEGGPAAVHRESIPNAACRVEHGNWKQMLPLPSILGIRLGAGITIEQLHRLVAELKALVPPEIHEIWDAETLLVWAIASVNNS